MQAQVAKQPHRRRSPSDPFADIYSSHRAPLFTTAAPSSQQSPPPVPPKSSSKPNRHHVSASMNRDNVVEAVRDTVTVRHVEPRVRMGRSQTQMPPIANVRPAPPQASRSHSQDSVLRAANTVEKAKTSSRKTAPKKGSSHADVIDRLDFSGVGPMFHHDGPFDACAPSRNRHRTKAPMLAWSGTPAADKDAFAAAIEVPSNLQSAYPSPTMYTPYEPPKKKHDAIAEAWGIHEPEPFEDFSAGGGYSTIRDTGDYTASSRNGTLSSSSRRNRDREAYRDDAGTPGRRQPAKRSALPPPQPIFVPEAAENSYPTPPSPGAPASPGGPKRSKSLMHRIRKMRDAPNVPVGYDEDAQGNYGRDPSPPSSAENSNATHASSQAYAARPTHRAQNSFLGRFGRGTSATRDDNISPISDGSEAYVYVEDPSSRRDKSLPPPPGQRAVNTPPEDMRAAYFDGTAGSPGGAGLGRKQSLLKKVKGVVKK